MGLGSYEKTAPITRIGAVGDAKPINLNNRAKYTSEGELCQIGPRWLGLYLPGSSGSRRDTLPGRWRQVFDSNHLYGPESCVHGCLPSDDAPGDMIEHKGEVCYTGRGGMGLEDLFRSEMHQQLLHLSIRRRPRNKGLGKAPGILPRAQGPSQIRGVLANIAEPRSL